MRLINANALMEFARNHINGMIDCNDIARFPTTDAEPVRHGRWIEDGGFNTCSLCGNYFDRYDDGGYYQDFDYCPKCGAKMDLKE